MSPTTILIFAYYSYKDPVFQSAVLPYFTNFPQKEKYQFILLTFEHENFSYTSAEEQAITTDLREQNIIWIKSKWRSGRFKLIKKVLDLVISVTLTTRLIRKHKVRAIYSEGFPGGILSYYIAKLCRRPHMIHTYEPHADYMLEANVWTERSWEYRLLKSQEKKIGLGSDHVFTATELMCVKLRDQQAKGIAHRVPSCVDLSLFSHQVDSRTLLRNQWGVAEDEVVLCYLGKIGGMYFDQELVDLLRAFQEQGRKKYRICLFSPEDLSPWKGRLQDLGFSSESIIIQSLTRQEVPAYLSACDVGVCAIRPIPSRRYSSPIKNGEYWACGLPVLVPKGVSDDYLFVQEHNLGIVIDSLAQEEYISTVHNLEAFLDNNNRDEFQKRARSFVEHDRNVVTYQNLYHSVFQTYAQ